MRWILYLFVLVALNSNLGFAQTNDTLVFKQYKDQKTITLLDTIINGNTLKLEYHIDTLFRDYMVDTKRYPLFINYNNWVDSFYVKDSIEAKDVNSYKHLYDEQTYLFTTLGTMDIVEQGKVHNEILYYCPTYFSFVMHFGKGNIMVFVSIKNKISISNQIPVLEDNFILFPEFKVLGFPHIVGYYANETILVKYDNNLNFYDCKVRIPCIPEDNDFSKVLSFYKNYMPKISKCKTPIKDFNTYINRKYFGFH